MSFLKAREKTNFADELRVKAVKSEEERIICNLNEDVVEMECQIKSLLLDEEKRRYQGKKRKKKRDCKSKMRKF